jgi:quinoprotein dehydrogenase-associated probable ABC transporter substrate-binding protein
MYSRCLSCLLLFAIGLQGRVLRVCADPNNLPLSGQQQPGFENRMAELVAAHLKAKVEFVWWLERKNLVRNTLLSGKCDALMNVPEGMPGIATTRPYYRSSYVLVQKRPVIRSLDDPALRNKRIGVHIVAENLAPPAAWLARRGIVENVKGYSLFGPFDKPNPPTEILDALVRGDIDVAIVWGPLAGWYARAHSLNVQVVRTPGTAPPPLEYSMAVGVRRSDMALKNEIEKALEGDKQGVRRILSEFAIPEVPR